MTTFSSASKSNRILQSKRYTIGQYDSQEAYTRVLDLNATEIYTQQDSLPSTSDTLPFSGSSQDSNFITSGSGADEVNIARYYYRIELTPTTTVTSGKYLTWFAVSGSSSEIGYDNAVSPQVIEATQLVNWVSNKYIRPIDSANLAETPGVDPGEPGYNVYIRKGNTASEELNKVPDNDIVFDYKTGVLQWMNASNAPAAGNSTNNRMYLSGYSYVGQTLDQFVASGSGGDATGAGFPFSGSAVITGSLLVSGSVAGEGVNFIDAPITASVISASGAVNVGEITGSGATFGSASIDHLTVNTLISASTLVTTGSNEFGDTVDDTQTLIGTVNTSGSIVNITSSLVEVDSTTIHLSGSTVTSGSVNVGGTLTIDGISDVSASIAEATGQAGIFVESGSSGIFASTSSLQITGSTLDVSPYQPSYPDPAITSSQTGAKYAVVVSESVYHYNANVGVPTSNAWRTNLDGSHFDNFDHNTDISEILRFVAGILSSSAPAASPNTRIYGALSQSAVSNNNAGSRPNGNIPQASTNTIISYLDSKGFAESGSQLFYNVSDTLKGRFNRSKTFGSDPSGTTVVTSSLTPASELFGLGTITGTPQTVVIASSASFIYSNNSAESDTFVSSSNNDVSQTGTGGSIIKIGNINTANPAVIPNTFQDGFFEGAFEVQQNFDSNTAALTDNPSGSAGYYTISQSVALKTGSGAFTSFKELNERVFLISSSLDGAIATNTLAVSAKSSGSTNATSASLSGAPYLLTANWQIGTTSTGIFNPMFVDNTNVAALTEQPADSKIALAAASNHAITANIDSNGKVNSNDAVFNSGGTLARSGSGGSKEVPFETDIAILSGSLTFNAGSGGGTGNTNITRTGISTGNGSSQFTIRNTIKNRAGGTSTYDSTIPYHKAGEFGQPADSGSLAYYGAAQGVINNQRLTFGTTTRDEDFVGEKYRLRLTDNVLSGSYDLGDHVATASFATYNLGGKDLQVKPGFLIYPGDSSFKYWLEDPNTGETYKYYVRAFQKDSSEVAGSASTFAINLVKSSDSNNVTLADWDTGTSAGDIACIVLYQYSAIGGENGLSNARWFDMSNINGLVASQKTYSGNTNAKNPFGATITVAGMAGGATINSGTTTHTLNDGQGSAITNGNPNVLVLVRYAGGASIDPIKRIDVQLS